MNVFLGSNITSHVICRRLNNNFFAEQQSNDTGNVWNPGSDITTHSSKIWLYVSFTRSDCRLIHVIKDNSTLRLEK